MELCVELLLLLVSLWSKFLRFHKGFCGILRLLRTIQDSYGCLLFPKDGTLATMPQFQRWRAANASLTIAHIKGFGEGIGSCYDDEAIKDGT